jgi:hypothetical protein
VTSSAAKRICGWLATSKKVRRAQVLVALLVVGVEAVCVDHELDGRGRG